MDRTFKAFNIKIEYPNPDDEPPMAMQSITFPVTPEDEYELQYGGSISALARHTIEESITDGAKLLSFDMREITMQHMVGVEALTVGETTRAYGGPEEGGWWYDHFEPARVIFVPKRKVERMKAKLQRWCDERNGWRSRHDYDRWVVRTGIEGRTPPQYYS
jgi:hypothetical protein